MRDRKGPRPPKLDVASLEKAAFQHLQRYAATSEQLRRVLTRRLQRAIYRTEDPDDRPDAEQVTADIAAVVARMAELGMVDDRKLAFSLARELMRTGGSVPLVRMKLRAKGVPSDVLDEAIAAALEASREVGVDPQFASAAAYARRRRLGPFRRSPEERSERRQKDLAALARRGFSYGVAKRVIDADDAADLPQPVW